MAFTKFQISKQLSAPTTLQNGAIASINVDGVIDTYLGNINNQPVLFASTFQSVSQFLIEPITGDQMTLLFTSHTIKIIDCIVVMRGGGSVNFSLYSTSDRSVAEQNVLGQVTDFTSGNFPSAETSGYKIDLIENVVVPKQYLVLILEDVPFPFSEFFVQINYTRFNPLS